MISDRMLLFIVLSAVFALVGVVLLYCSASYEIAALEAIGSICLAPSILMIFAVNIYVWKRSKPNSITFDKMVKQ